MATTETIREIAADAVAGETGPAVLDGQETAAPRKIPDFMGRMKEIWGDTVFPEGTMTRLVRRDRDGDE